MIKDLVLEEIKELNIEVSNKKIDIYINKVISKVLNYCHINSIPNKLNQTVASIVIDLILNDISSLKEEVKSIQEGDTTITFQSKTIKLNDDIISNYISELNSFRKPPGFK